MGAERDDVVERRGMVLTGDGKRKQGWKGTASCLLGMLTCQDEAWEQ